MSTPCEEIRPELEALLGAMAEGQLDGPGAKRLSQILKEHPDVCTQILARIQAQVGEGQIVSARLLPVAEGAPGATPAASVADAEAEKEVAPTR